MEENLEVCSTVDNYFLYFGFSDFEASMVSLDINSSYSFDSLPLSVLLSSLVCSSAELLSLGFSYKD
jgi:hypothetical protein